MFRAASFCAILLGAVAFAYPGDTELDQYEEKCIARAAERVARAAKSERVLWVKELEAAYPGKVTNPTTEDEYGAWFDLLADKKEEWRKDAAPNPRIAELFDRVVQRMELGPVPSIKRDEFKHFARRVLMRDQPRRDDPLPDQFEDADKAFRVLDRNGDSELDRDEMTIFLRDEKIRVDTDGNGRISKTEYRDYFQRKVTAKVESNAVKNGEAVRTPDGKVTPKSGKAGNSLPDWFTTLDADKDGQISLFEWRQDKRPPETFKEMDLDGDGLLTREEYLRYLKLKDIELNQKKREEGRP